MTTRRERGVIISSSTKEMECVIYKKRRRMMMRNEEPNKEKLAFSITPILESSRRRRRISTNAAAAGNGCGCLVKIILLLFSVCIILYNDNNQRRWSLYCNASPQSYDPLLLKNINAEYGGNHPFEIIHQRNQYNNNNNNNEYDDDEEEYHRRLQISNGSYKSIRFTFKVEKVKQYAIENPTRAAHADFLMDTMLPRVARIWSDALKVYPTSEFTLTDNNCFQLDEIWGPKTFFNTDVVMVVEMDSSSCFDDSGSTVLLGFARACLIDQFNRPLAGKIDVCSGQIDLNNKQSRDRAAELLSHELAHVLGFSASLYHLYYDSKTGRPRTTNHKPQKVQCVDGITRTLPLASKNTLQLVVNEKGIRSFEVVTPTVRNVVRNQFNCQDMIGARLENQPTSEGDCFGQHWDKRLFSSDLMTAVARKEQHLLTPLTLAFFEDMGWYKADYSKAKVTSFGHGAGCDFVTNDCIDHGKVPKWARGTFCNSDTDISCSPLREAIKLCDVKTKKKNHPVNYRYFDDPKVGGRLEQMDYCPVYAINLVLNPSGTSYDCRDPAVEKFGRPGETFGPDSKCFEVSGPDIRFDRYCLKMRCNSNLRAVQIMAEDLFSGIDTVVTCKNDGQKINLPWILGLRVTCPNLLDMCPDLGCRANCAGRGICNYDRKKPKCDCYDPFDPSPYCINSPTAEKQYPTLLPSVMPSSEPSLSSSPSTNPTVSPTLLPSSPPSNHPTYSHRPSPIPSISLQPSSHPSPIPTSKPSSIPSSKPSYSPRPSSKPTISNQPTISSQPTISPTVSPSGYPTSAGPSSLPSKHPTSKPSNIPSLNPFGIPSIPPTGNPTITGVPSLLPSKVPTKHPSFMPQWEPSIEPSESSEVIFLTAENSGFSYYDYYDYYYFDWGGGRGRRRRSIGLRGLFYGLIISLILSMVWIQI